jgi:hypothetical protein
LDKRKQMKEIRSKILRLTDLHCSKCKDPERGKILTDKNQKYEKVPYCNVRCGVGIQIRKSGKKLESLEKSNPLNDKSKKGSEKQSVDNFIRLSLKGYEMKEIAHLFGVTEKALTDYCVGHNLQDIEAI